LCREVKEDALARWERYVFRDHGESGGDREGPAILADQQNQNEGITLQRKRFQQVKECHEESFSI